MKVLLYLGNMTSDSGAGLESGYLVKDDDSLDNIFIGEVGCYSSSPNFSWDNYTVLFSAIFIGY